MRLRVCVSFGETALLIQHNATHFRKPFRTAQPLTAERVRNSTQTGREKNTTSKHWNEGSYLETCAGTMTPKIIKHCRQFFWFWLFPPFHRHSFAVTSSVWFFKSLPHERTTDFIVLGLYVQHFYGGIPDNFIGSISIGHLWQ